VTSRPGRKGGENKSNLLRGVSAGEYRGESGGWEGKRESGTRAGFSQRKKVLKKRPRDYVLPVGPFLIGQGLFTERNCSMSRQEKGPKSKINKYLYTKKKKGVNRGRGGERGWKSPLSESYRE